MRKTKHEVLQIWSYSFWSIHPNTGLKMHQPIPPCGIVHPLGNNSLFTTVHSWQMGRKRRLLYGMPNTEPARPAKLCLPQEEDRNPVQLSKESHKVNSQQTFPCLDISKLWNKKYLLRELSEKHCSSVPRGGLLFITLFIWLCTSYSILEK